MVPKISNAYAIPGKCERNTGRSARLLRINRLRPALQAGNGWRQDGLCHARYSRPPIAPFVRLCNVHMRRPVPPLRTGLNTFPRHGNLAFPLYRFRDDSTGCGAICNEFSRNAGEKSRGPAAPVFACARIRTRLSAHSTDGRDTRPRVDLRPACNLHENGAGTPRRQRIGHSRIDVNLRSTIRPIGRSVTHKTPVSRDQTL
jgi:hypothetical protein